MALMMKMLACNEGERGVHVDVEGDGGMTK